MKAVIKLRKFLTDFKNYIKIVVFTFQIIVDYGILLVPMWSFLKP